MAESTKRLTEDSKAMQPQVSWSRIAGLRNVLVHDYLRIDFGIVWEIVQIDLPELKRAVQAILDTSGGA